MQGLPSPAYTIVTDENHIISQKFGTHSVICCPFNYTTALAIDYRVGCNDENNVGLEGNDIEVWFNCSLSEECILKEACPLFKIVKQLSRENPDLSEVLKSYLRKDCAKRGTCCPRSPKVLLEPGKCKEGSICTYKWNCKEYVKTRAMLTI